MLGVRGQYRNIIVYEDALNETVYLTFTTALNAASTSLRSSHTLTFNPYTGILTIPTALVTDLQCTTLEVSGLSTLHAIIGTSATLSTTLDVTGATTLSNTLTVLGSFLTSLGGALTVTGISTFNGNVSITSNKTLTVGTGATTLGGTLGVTGATTLNGVLDTYNTTTVHSTLTVLGAYLTDLGGALTVAGITTHNDNVSITGTKTLSVGTGATTLGGTLGVTGGTTLSSTLGVTGATTLSSTLGVTGVITANVGADTFKMTPSGVLYVTYSTNQGSGIIFGNNLWYATDYLGAPATTGTTNIGSSSLRMGKIWTTLLNCSSTVDFLAGLNVTGTSALGVVTSGNQSITGTLSVSGTSYLTGLVGIGTAPATYQLLVNNSFAVAGTSLLNGTTTIGGDVTITPGYLQMYKINSVISIDHSTGTASSYPFCVFSYNGGTCGTITQVGLTNVVAYNTTSDYRLKQKIQPAMGCLDMVMNLKPSTYYYVGHDVPQIGLIAHECQEVLPFAVNGVKDGTEMWCDKCKLEKCDCCEKVCRPVYQGIDYGKLVPVLIGAIQDLTEVVKDLKSRLEKAGL
jgi:hypothetical protein